MGDPKKHHYIPRVYLRSWADNEGKVLLYLKGDSESNPRLVSVADVGAEKNLYTARGGDKTVETDFFSKIDGAASDVFRDIISNVIRDLDIDSKEKISHFINTLFMRTPEYIKMMRDFNEESRKSGLKSAERYKKETGLDFTEGYQKEQYDDSPKIVRLYTTIGEETAMTKHYENDFRRTMNASWQIIDIDSSFSLITSDNPLDIIDFSKTNSLFELPESFGMLLPLSPNILLMIGNDISMISLYKSMPQREFIKLVNIHSIFRARKQIFTTVDVPQGFILKHIQTG